MTERAVASEVVGGVVEVLARGLVLLVHLGRQHAHMAGPPIDLDVGAADGAGDLGVGAQNGILDGRQEVVQVYAQLIGSASQLRHVDVHGSSGPLSSGRCVGRAARGRGRDRADGS